MHEKENILDSLTCHFHDRSLNITHVITRAFNAIHSADGAMHDWLPERCRINCSSATFIAYPKKVTF